MKGCVGLLPPPGQGHIRRVHPRHLWRKDKKTGKFICARCKKVKGGGK